MDEQQDIIEQARFYAGGEVGMARAELMVVERVVPARVVRVRERVDAVEGASPGRVVRTATRLPDDELLRVALEGVDWDAVGEAATPASYRAVAPDAGLTPQESHWARAVAFEWSTDSGREVPWSATVHEDTLVVLRLGGDRHAVVGVRAGRVLGWARTPSWRRLAVAVAWLLGFGVYAGLVGFLGRASPISLTRGLIFAAATLALGAVVVHRSCPRLHAIPPPSP